MTGIERNADVVHMATYAPLFAHVEGWQWRPDLIWYDNLRSFRTVSWYVQQLYGQFRGKNTLKLQMGGKNVTGADGQGGLFASAVLDGDKVYVKVVNTSEESRDITLNFTGLKKKATLKADGGMRLMADRKFEDNSLRNPEDIVPLPLDFEGEGKQLETSVPALSFSIFVLERQ